MNEETMQLRQDALQMAKQMGAQIGAQIGGLTPVNQPNQSLAVRVQQLEDRLSNLTQKFEKIMAVLSDRIDGLDRRVG